MKQWQIGYRMLPLSGTPYNTPYTDLPEFEAPQREAFALHSKLQLDFPTAEWRLVEVRNSRENWNPYVWCCWNFTKE